MNTRLWTGLTAGILLSSVALADVSGVYHTEDKSKMSISYRDDSHVRMDLSKDNFLLLKGDKTYTVNREGSRWTAMDLAEIGKLGLGGMAGIFNSDDDDDDEDEGTGSFRDTGRTETIAGYKGKVYEVTEEDGERSEVVLTNHKDITSLTRGMLLFGQKSIKNMGLTEESGLPMELISSGYTGILRQDKDLLLVSVDKSSKGADFYALPAGTKMETMPDVGSMMKGMEGMDMEDMEKKMKEAMRQMQEQMKQR